MGLKNRVSQLMTSDIDRLLDRAEDPTRAIEQLIGDLEESIVDLRRETVAAVAGQNRLRKGLFAAEEVAGAVEREASMALARGDELRARHILSQKIGPLKARDTLELELFEAGRLSARLVATLIRMEDRAQLARRKQDALVRRLRAAKVEPGSPATPRRPNGALNALRGQVALDGDARAFDGYTEAVTALEQEASRAGGEEIKGGGRC